MRAHAVTCALTLFGILKITKMTWKIHKQKIEFIEALINRRETKVAAAATLAERTATEAATSAIAATTAAVADGAGATPDVVKSSK